MASDGAEWEAFVLSVTIVWKKKPGKKHPKITPKQWIAHARHVVEQARPCVPHDVGGARAVHAVFRQRGDWRGQHIWQVKSCARDVSLAH